MSDHDDLQDLIRASPWFVDVLWAVRASGLPDAWVGAGVIRDLVWGVRFGAGFDPAAVRDVDVPYFDPADLSRSADDRATAVLGALRPAVAWEAKNQAAVHTWYAERFGGPPVAPLTSVADALGTWPEFHTCVAVRLRPDDDIEICAPYGLDDLMNGVWRPNPRRISGERSAERLARQRPAERWPGVRVIPWPG
jgi:uncharacterized protein